MVTTASQPSLRLLHFEKQPDGISLYLAPIGLWGVRRSFAITVFVALVAAAAAHAKDYSAATLVGFFAFSNLLACLMTARRRADLLVLNNQLQVRQTLGRWLRSRRLTLPRDEILALNSLGGLRIVNAAREWCWFPERDPSELAYLASLLRQNLLVPEEASLRGNELPVHFTGPFWPWPTPGVLGVRPGELSLRVWRQLVPFFIFRAKNGPRSSWAHVSTMNVMNLEPHEIVGRTPANQPTSLVISPTTPLFLRRNYTFFQGIAGPKLRTLFFWRAATFQIFSEDGKALQAALAVFWSSRGLGEKKH